MKNYFVLILFFFIILMNFILFFNRIVQAKNDSKNTRQQIEECMAGKAFNMNMNEKISILCRDPESLFIASVKKMLMFNNVKNPRVSLNNKKLTIIEKGGPFPDKDYKILFGNDSENSSFKCAMANSICNFYGISRKELLHLRQQKVVVNKTKKEINKLFDESLDIINKYGNEQRIDEAKLAKLITGELIKKQNEPLAPDAQIPTVPTLL